MPSRMDESQPGTRHLDGHRLARCLEAGMRRVVADQDRLNRINVFPVPDGDTGTNLALTMNAVRTALAGHRDEHAGRTLERIADAALDGARGNSGAIFAQFFLGLGDACADRRLLATGDLIEAVASGAAYAREALSDPREGTILTVLTAFSRELEGLAGRELDFAGLLERGLARAREALAATQNQLEALRRAGVVDAGGQGFVDLLDGIMACIRGDAAVDLDEGQPPEDIEAAFPDMGASGHLEHRYCTECMVTGDHVNRRALREALAPLGASLVVAGTHRKVRVHIHVNEPDRVFEIAASHGEISSRKADDMRQQSGTAAGSAQVAVVVDSAADLPESEFERLGIHMVPVRVHFGERSYLDKVSLSSDQFYAELASNPQHPKTSQPAPGDFRRLYQFLVSHHPGVLSIHLTGRVSGTFQAAASAAARIEGHGRVLAVDSRNASLGQGLVALEAAELARAGLSLDDIAAGLDDSIARTKTWGLLRDVSYAVRGGRVPRYRKIIADLARLTPIIRTYPDGRIASGGALFGRRNLVDRFARMIAREAAADRRYRVAVAHASDPERAQRLLERLLDLVANVESHFLTEVGSALGAHGGPGTLVASLQALPARRA